MTHTFSITFDYLCPFARNAHEHVVAGLQGGADWDVEFLPFSLTQNHVREGEPAVWDRDDWRDAAGILALTAGLAVRDRWPQRFLDAHLALFSARHDRGQDIRDEGVVRSALRSAGLDPDEVLAEVETGEPLSTLRKEHDYAVDEYGVFGVPTFIAGSDAVFVRLMERPGDDHDLAIRTVERVVDLLTGWPVLNEYKHTSIPR